MNFERPLLGKPTRSPLPSRLESVDEKDEAPLSPGTVSRRLLLPLLTSLLGCGTITNLAGGNLFEAGPKIYGGVRQDVATMEQGGRHEPYSVILTGMDIPFSLVLDTVVLPVTVPVVLFTDASPESELRRIHDKILRTDNLSFDFSFKGYPEGSDKPVVRPDSPPTPDFTGGGSLWLKRGNKLRLELWLRNGERRKTALYVSDGRRATWAFDGVPIATTPVPEGLEAAHRELAFCGGFLGNTWPPTGEWEALFRQRGPHPEAPLATKGNEIPLILNCSWTQAEWLDQSGYERVLKFDLLCGSRIPIAVELWYQPGTFRLRGRQAKIGKGVLTQEFEHFDFEHEIPDDQFIIPD